MGDEASRDGGAQDDLQVGSDVAHLLVERPGENAPVVGHLGHVGGEVLDHDEVHVADVLSHGDLGGLDDGLGLVLVLVENIGNVVDALVRQGPLVAHSQNQLGVQAIVGHDPDELGEMPAVPLPHAHGALVDALVKRVEGRNALDDVVVVLVDAELDLGAGVGVAETKLGAVDVALLQSLEQLVGVETNAAQERGNDLGGIGGLALDAGEGGADLAGYPLVDDAQHDLALLSARLRQVEFEGVLEVLGHDALGNEIDGLQTVGGRAERSR